MVKRALISVFDKTGVAAFAKRLSDLGVEIISTGGTSALLRESGLQTIEVQDITGFPECLDGRVKTLHPKIHCGLLAVRSDASHMEQMRRFGIGMIDLLVSNLYPFKQTIQRPGVTFEEVIEKIDIGGPAMLRSAAKNYPGVTVLVDPDDYDRVIDAISRDGSVPESLNLELAIKAFEHTAAYDALISEHLRNTAQTGLFPKKLTFTFEKAQEMRYGENPQQSAAFYADPTPAPGSLATFVQLHGKELSYNNINDLDGALSLLREFDAPAAVAVKHANPCGAATAGNLYDAYMKAYESDTESIFGGIVALNDTVGASVATEISKLFIEILAAPDFDEDALKILTKKKNIRLLKIGARAVNAPNEARLYIKKVDGGLLAQTKDDVVLNAGEIEFVTEKRPTDKEMEDLIFAMTVVKHTKSNAIVLAKDLATIGVGPGQNSRIMAAKIAIEIAGGRARQSVAASDAFFPFGDCVEAFAAAGVTAIIQPGGSKNDIVSIEACNRLGIAMVTTGIRHFRH